MASPNFEPGRPTENANELARLIERGLRETKAVDLEALCVLAGKKVQIARSIGIVTVSHSHSLAKHSTASYHANLSHVSSLQRQPFYTHTACVQCCPVSQDKN